MVVNALKDRNEESFRPYGVIVSACQDLLSDFNFFDISFIRRTGNCLAHAFRIFRFLILDILSGMLHRPIWPI